MPTLGWFDNLVAIVVHRWRSDQRSGAYCHEFRQTSQPRDVDAVTVSRMPRHKPVQENHPPLTLNHVHRGQLDARMTRHDLRQLMKMCGKQCARADMLTEIFQNRLRDRHALVRT